MKVSVFGLGLLALGAAACANGTGGAGSASTKDAAAGPAPKMSLDEALDDHRKVTLVDDETGEEKLICKRVVVTGDRFVRKTCATPKEWAQKKQDSRDELDGLKRTMDAKCPNQSC
ncbi:MAG: hypothetical protein AB7F91_10840 [Parvularculaceae bacterium]|nr:hypothetical protein [Parvularculaceae bacterium]